MDHVTFLQDLAVVMCVSAVITILFQRLRIPTVLGYLMAGLLIGPNTPPYSLITDVHSIQTLSELGVVFLLFTIGLEFSISKLMKVGLVALFAGTLEIALMIGVGYWIGAAFGWKPMDSLFLGAILSISSTTIIAKVLVDMRMVQEKFAQVILGILIVEDILAIVIIALLSGVATTGHLTFHEAAVSTMRVVTFIVIGLIVSALTVPKLLSYIRSLRVHETLVITVLGLAFGASLLAAKAGFSAALGAFLMGAVIAETRHAHDVVGRMEPLRDMFTAVFFVSVGMLIDPRIILEYAWPITVITLATIAGKIATCSLGAFLAGHSGTNSLKVGLGLAQIGEFSFIIARLGQSLNVTSAFLYPIAVSVSAITALTTPLLMKNTSAVIGGLRRTLPKSVSNFAGYYTSWLTHVGGVRLEGSRKAEIWKGLGQYLPRLVAYLVFGAVVYFLALQARAYFGWEAGSAFWTGVGLAMFPPLLGLAHTADRIFWNAIFLNLWKADGHMDPAGEAGRGVHNVFRFLVMVFFGLLFLAVGSFFNPTPPIGVGLAGLVIISGVLLWGSVRKTHEKMESVMLGVFDREASSAEAPAKVRMAQDELIKFIRDQYPWEVEILDFVVPFSESALHQSLRALGLRTATGASVVAVYREDDSIPNPGPDEVLQPGDVLLMVGDKEQVRRASEFLRQKARQKPVSAGSGPAATRRVVVRPGAACVGRTIRQIGIRSETQATVLGLDRGGKVYHNPESEMTIEAGDELVLFGRTGDLDRAAELLSRFASDPV